MRPTSAALRRAARAHFTDPTKRRGLLVAFEGPDGSGKTTQRKLFKTWLKSEGYDVVTTKWNSSDLIKPIIKSRKAVRALSPEEFSLLHGADFRHRVEQVILPALWDGKLVIADRFLFTGLARDVARGLDLDWVLKLYQPLLWPDLVFYFSVSPVTSGKRVTATRLPNFYEAGQDVTQVDDPVESYQRFIGRVIREYESLALIFNMITVDAEQSIGEQHHQIRQLFLEGEKRPWSDWNADAVAEWLATRRNGAARMTKAKPARARLIAVDGVDPAAVLAEARAALGQPCARRDQPVGRVGRVSRSWRWQSAAAGSPSARTLLLLYAADLAFRLRWQIRPALAEGRTVIAAPYVDTAMAFGRAAGLKPSWLMNLFRFAPRAHERRFAHATARPRRRGRRAGSSAFSAERAAARARIATAAARADRRGAARPLRSLDVYRTPRFALSAATCARTMSLRVCAQVVRNRIDSSQSALVNTSRDGSA